ncbi:hypothetical protein B0T16DRAFT_384652 [Cercophora newfieldiana]|uniref:WIF domain-containing protein n=1 Tax=Cercophora newfieldiana TaxID=92897 RepID=A0AA40D0B4_9PEZI|nr:hypothetical protein B0T16DRAFT_384652 [Cercophora newfieldiana]
MKSSLIRSLLVSIFLVALNLVLTAAPVSASPVPQLLQGRDVEPVPSTVPLLPIPAAALTELEAKIRDRARLLAGKLKVERASLVQQHRKELGVANAKNQAEVDGIVNGADFPLGLSDDQTRKLVALDTPYEMEANQMLGRHIREKNELLKAQQDEVDKLKSEWKAVTGGKKELEVAGLEIPRQQTLRNPF